MGEFDFGKLAIVHVSPVDWRDLFQRPHHLTFQMAKTFDRVVYLYRGLHSLGLKSEDFKRLVNHLRLLKGGAAVKGNLPICCPRFSFLPCNGSAGDWLNALLAFLWVRRSIGNRPCILWASAPSPSLFHLKRLLKPEVLVFDWLDDFSLFGLPHRVIQAQERLIKASDVVFTSSLLLYERARELSPRGRCHYLPNGVDLQHWRPITTRDSRRPIIGYFGTLSHWVDWKLVGEVASRLSDYDFIFIGPKKGVEDEKLPSSPNIRFLGRVPYSELPAIASSFRVGWLPFKVDDRTRTINPVKVYEYLALGKPVVSSPLPETAALCGRYVRLAVGPEEHIREIREAVEAASRPSEVRKLVEHLSWDRLWRLALMVLKDVLKDKTD